MNLYFAERSFRSSIIPNAKRTATEKKKLICATPVLNGNHRNKAIIIPAIIAIPPMVGMGAECSFRASGISYKRYFLTRVIIGGIVISVTTNAVIKHNKANL